jgi:hypothetical protein
MAEFHVYSNTVADGTNNSIVRPSDWNSAHSQIITLTGNTAGQSTVSGTNILFAGGSNVVVSGVQGANVATIMISGSNQSVQTQASGNIAGTGYSSTTIAGTVPSATLGTNGLSINWPPFITTAGAAQTTQTQPAGIIAGAGTTTTTQAGSTVGMTLNSSGLSAAWPPFITTYAAQTNQTGNIYVTAGSTQLSSTAGIDLRSVSFAGAGIASVGVSGGVVLVSATQSVQTQASGNIAGVGTTFAGANVSGSMTLNSNGLNLSLSGGAGGGAGDGYNIINISGNTTGTVNTYASATIALAGGNNITMSQSSNSISINAPPSSSLVAGSNIALSTGGSTISIHNIGAGSGLTTTTQAGTTIGMTHNTAGLSIAYPPFITTAAGGGGGAFSASGGSSTFGTLNFSNQANGVTFSNSAGALALNHALAGTTTGFTGTNIAVSMTHNSAGLAMQMNVSTGAANSFTASDMEMYPLGNNTVLTSYGQNTLHFQGFRPIQNISMTAVEMFVSLSSVTSAVSHSVGQTMSYGWYSKGSGTNSSRYESMATSSMYMAASYSSNLSGGLTVANGANSYTTSSAGTVFGSVLSGMKIMSLPMGTSLSAGGDYMFAFANSTASVGNTGALRASFMHQTLMSGASASFGIIATNTLAVTNTSNTNEPFLAAYTATSGAWPSTIAKSQFSAWAATQAQMYLYLEA